MMDRVMEIVSFVMKKALYQGENVSEKNLMGILVQLGYSFEEIGTAFKFLHSLSGALKGNPVQLGHIIKVRKGQRVFSPTEQKKLSLAFQTEILRLNKSILTDEETELILMEAMQSEAEDLGLKELEAILHKVIKDEERLLLICPQSLTEVPAFLFN